MRAKPGPPAYYAIIRLRGGLAHPRFSSRHRKSIRHAPPAMGYFRKRWQRAERRPSYRRCRAGEKLLVPWPAPRLSTSLRAAMRVCSTSCRCAGHVVSVDGLLAPAAAARRRQRACISSRPALSWRSSIGFGIAIACQTLTPT